MGGTMRLGAYEAIMKKGSQVAKAYKATTAIERHRHRYEVNPEYVERLTAAGMIFSGTSPDGRLMEMVELPPSAHPFFVGTQFHPELTARPLRPHPLFTAFVKAAYESKK
jgi:CTP synthase